MVAHTTDGAALKAAGAHVDAVRMRILKHLSYSNVLATIAVFVALGGTGYAAAKITGRQVADGSLTGRDIRDHSLTARDFAGSIAGPAGAAGQTGAAGSAGAHGADGRDGVNGRDGINGVDGSDGVSPQSAGAGNDSTVSLQDVPTVVASTSLTVPAASKVAVVGSAQINNEGGFPSPVLCAVAVDGVPDEDRYTQVAAASGGTPTAGQLVSTTVRPVATGVHTVELRCRKTVLTATIEVPLQRGRVDVVVTG